MDRHEYLPPMAACRGRLQFCCLARLGFGLVEFFLVKENASQAGPSLISKRVEFNCLSA
jgi:hypothetical protein